VKNQKDLQDIQKNAESAMDAALDGLKFLASHRAKISKIAIDSFISAGFSRDEAFTLVKEMLLKDQGAAK
jgi:DNA polymerase III delta prime subunit